MNKIPEYNINGTMIIGVDAGYGNYKTAHTSFPTGIIKSDKAPIFTREFIKYDGCYEQPRVQKHEQSTYDIDERDSITARLERYVKEVNERDHRIASEKGSKTKRSDRSLER